MSLRLLFSRHARHLWIMLFLLVLGGGGAFYGRQLLQPAGFGELGPYRSAALAEEMAHPLMLQSDETCLKCHADVGEARADSVHKAVRCSHCHGLGRDHVIAATLAADDSSHEIPAAEEWSGDFTSHQDLFTTQHRATCLACHERVVGMPAAFRSIVVADHLDEQGASEVDADNVCFECHDGHSPGL
ncbi:MAG: hypothetical protein KDA85_09795 [Planctomycetaceae bacterium]|nr:hypothetical protein [Planctomycetaceae bacterium]